MWAKSTSTANGWPSSTSSKRPRTGGTDASPTEMASQLMPSSQAVVAAPTALMMLNLPGQLQLQSPPPPPKRRAALPDRHLGGVGGPEGHHPDVAPRQHFDQTGAPLVRPIDYRHANLALAEQLRLGGEVGLHGPVVVQVVLAQVGENAGREVGALTRCWSRE